jgi:hypothetical protein
MFEGWPDHDTQSPSSPSAPRLLERVGSLRHVGRRVRPGVDDLLDVAHDHQTPLMTTPSLISDAVLEAHSEQCERAARSKAKAAPIPGRLQWRPDLLLWQFVPEDCDAIEALACNGRMDATVEVTVR